MKIACYSTHTVDLKKQRQHTQPGSLKISNQSPKNQQNKIKNTNQKNNPSKRQLFCLPRPMLYNARSTDIFLLLQVVSSTYSSQIYMAGFAKKQFYPQNSVRKDPRSFFFLFFFYQNTFYRIPNQNVLFKASFFYNIFSSLKDDSHAAV